MPVIGSDSGAIPWVISQISGGRTFAEGDTEALAELLTDAQADRDRWRRLGARGQKGMKQFTARAAANTLDETMRPLLEDPRWSR